MKDKTLEEKYESFKMLWMISHEITVEIISLLAEQWRADEEGDLTFEEYIEEYGFGGEIWPCFEEFLESDLPTINQSIL